MKFQDYYQTLGIDRRADADAIRTAYRSLALKWHPDRHSEEEKEAAEGRFKQISEAYEVLSDPDKRSRYDQFGEQWEQGQEFQPPEGGARTMSREELERAFGGTGGFSDFFSSMFGQASRGAEQEPHRRFQHRGADVQAELRLPISAALRGGSQSFQIPTRSACLVCGGVGFRGERVCVSCGGVGQVRRVREVRVTIPPSVHDGSRLRLKGLGDPGAEGGEAGDLYLSIHLLSDEVFRVAGANVEADVPLAPWELLQGAKVSVRTPRGSVDLRVPAETPAGSTLRLRGQGLDDGRGGRGDFLAVIRLALPSPLSVRQRELLEQIAQAGPSRVSGGAREDHS